MREIVEACPSCGGRCPENVEACRCTGLRLERLPARSGRLRVDRQALSRRRDSRRRPRAQDARRDRAFRRQMGSRPPVAHLGDNGLGMSAVTIVQKFLRRVSRARPHAAARRRLRKTRIAAASPAAETGLGPTSQPGSGQRSGFARNPSPHTG
jgi:hypothetical protein